MRVPLLDSLNYNIFDVSTLSLYNSLQTPPEVPDKQRENARILSKRVENIGDIFSQSRTRWSVCVAPVFYIALEEIVQRIEIGVVQRPAPAPFFLSGKWFEMTRFLKWVSTKSMVRSVECALAPYFWNQHFEKVFIAMNWGEGLFFQYLRETRPSTFFSAKIGPISPCVLSAAHTVIFFGCRFFVKNTLGFELAHRRQLCNNYTFTWPLMMRDIKLFSV